MTKTSPKLALTKNLAGIPGLYIPQQGRSRRAMESVLDNFHALLKQHPFGKIPMAEISKASGVAIGTIYFRFSSKEHLLVALAEKIIREEIEPAYQKLFAANNRPGENLEGFLVAHFEAVSKVFGEYHYLLKPLTLISRETSDQKIRAFVKTLNGRVHRKLKATLLALAKEENPGVREESVDLAILMAGASLREALLYGEPLSDLIKGRNQAFLGDLASALAGYLTANKKG